MKTCFWLYLALTIGWMALIFYMSAQQGAESSHMSLETGELLGKLLVPGFNDWSAAAQTSWELGMEFAIRKAAHATEYAILGVLLGQLLGAAGQTGRRRFGGAFAIGVLYACSDEFHQLFVYGRSGQVRDVLIDAGGALLGLLLLSLVQRLVRKLTPPSPPSCGR